MSNKYKGLTVTFKKDINEDHYEALVKAISLFDGVLDVRGYEADADSIMNKLLVRYQYFNKLLEVLDDGVD